MHTLRLVLVATMLAACSNTLQPCSSRPTDPMCQDVDSNVPDGGDGGAADTGLDAGPVDAFMYPCGVACTGTTPVCHIGSHTCVACLSNTDCTSAAMPVCGATTHTCGPCMADAACNGRTGTLACNTTSGACVACTTTNETACGANSCNPMTNTCTTTPRTSIATCHACTADSECMSAMDRCVPMQFTGAAHGSYCLRQTSAVCSRPFTVPTPARASTSGAAAATYCAVDETVTTCEAVEALIADTPCSMPSDCGASGLADGRCEIVNTVANRCTYSCGTSADCPGGRNCGGAMYCGSP